MEEELFTEFIQKICKRPSMYIGSGSATETIAFICGYSYGKNTPISDRVFDRYVCIKNSFPTNYVWSYVMLSISNDDAEALRKTEEIILEFVKLRRLLSDDELIQYALDHTIEKNEGEAEKIFRQFDAALLEGLESKIKPLIEEHSEAHILWNGSYPKDVAEQLNAIFNEQSIKCIPDSNDSNKVQIITSGWPFPIEMNFGNGSWKVDAKDIIKFRLNK